MQIESQKEEPVELSDAHCHLSLFDSVDEVLKQASEKNIKTIVTAGGSNRDNEKTLEIVKHDNVFGVIGISPDAVGEGLDTEQLEQMIKKSKKIVGIGEIGLDFKIAKDSESRNAQAAVFEKQVDLAKELDLPIVIHSRRALPYVINILVEKKIEKAMFHFFEGGKKEHVEEIKRRGYIISVPPVRSEERERAIKEVDINSIVAETDSPVVGKSPIDVINSLSIISSVRNMDVNEIAEMTTNNLREFFYI